MGGGKAEMEYRHLFLEILLCKEHGSGVEFGFGTKGIFVFCFYYVVKNISCVCQFENDPVREETNDIEGKEKKCRN